VKTDADGKHDAFADPEQRYRRRYDLTVNDQVKETLSREPNVQCRSFFNDKGYLEVETPVLTDSRWCCGETFITHHNLDMPCTCVLPMNVYKKD
jgi:lysyl-tRNA synthetase class 2